MTLIGRHDRVAASPWESRAAVAGAITNRIRSPAMVSTVAIGVDGSDTAAKAVEMAVDVARRFDAKVVLLSAIRISSPTSGMASAGMATAGLITDPVELDWAYEKAARVRQVLENLEARLRRSGVECEMARAVASAETVGNVEGRRSGAWRRCLTRRPFSWSIGFHA